MTDREITRAFEQGYLAIQALLARGADYRVVAPAEAAAEALLEALDALNPVETGHGSPETGSRRQSQDRQLPV